MLTSLLQRHLFFLSFKHWGKTTECVITAKQHEPQRNSAICQNDTHLPKKQSSIWLTLLKTTLFQTLFVQSTDWTHLSHTCTDSWPPASSLMLKNLTLFISCCFLWPGSLLSSSACLLCIPPIIVPPSLSPVPQPVRWELEKSPKRLRNPVAFRLCASVF